MLACVGLRAETNVDFVNRVDEVIWSLLRDLSAGVLSKRFLIE